MICPECRDYTFVQGLTECPSCHTKVEICQPCFGTGSIWATIQRDGEHKTKDIITCSNCQGLGLLRVHETPSGK